MRARPLILAIVLTAFAATIATVFYHRPYFRGAKILPAAGNPEVMKYAQEFADSLSLSTQWNVGASLSEPPIYHQGGDGASPDGRFTLRQRKLRNDYHEISLLRGPGGIAETILVLQESDPGSGTSHDWCWSRDSEAIFISGSGTPAGHAHADSLALIYVVAQRTLYSIDLTPHLSKRMKGKTNAAGPWEQGTLLVRSSFRGSQGSWVMRRVPNRRVLQRLSSP